MAPRLSGHHRVRVLSFDVVSLCLSFRTNRVPIAFCSCLHHKVITWLALDRAMFFGVFVGTLYNWHLSPWLSLTLSHQTCRPSLSLIILNCPQRLRKKLTSLHKSTMITTATIYVHYCNLVNTKNWRHCNTSYVISTFELTILHDFIVANMQINAFQADQNGPIMLSLQHPESHRPHCQLA